MKCTNTACKWRSCTTCLGASSEEPPNVDAIDQIEMSDNDEVDENEGLEGVSASDRRPPQPEERESGKKARLWPHGRTTQAYQNIMEAVGQSGRASAAVVISATAHPSHWVSCVQQHLETFVYTRSWSNHSTQHGLALGKSLLLENILKDPISRKSVATGNSGIHTSSDFKFNNFLGMNQSLTDYDQIIEAYNINQGPQWYDGLNLSISGQELEQQSAKLTKAEQESHNVSVVADGSSNGLRNLITTNGVAPGQVACPVSALFFDDYDKLNSCLLYTSPSPRD